MRYIPIVFIILISLLALVGMDYYGAILILLFGAFMLAGILMPRTRAIWGVSRLTCIGIALMLGSAGAGNFKIIPDYLIFILMIFGLVCILVGQIYLRSVTRL